MKDDGSAMTEKLQPPQAPQTIVNSLSLGFEKSSIYHTFKGYLGMMQTVRKTLYV